MLIKIGDRDVTAAVHCGQNKAYFDLCSAIESVVVAAQAQGYVQWDQVVTISWNAQDDLSTEVWKQWDKDRE